MVKMMTLVDEKLNHFFLQLKPNEIEKTLFVISCSAYKSSKHEKTERWVNITCKEDYSKFQEFTQLRKNLLNFYSSIESEELAQEIYQGFKYQNPSRWRKAWKINRELFSSGASRAIYRYTGKLYKELDYNVLQALAEGTLNNVLIISAFHGPTLPKDWIPYYDLRMEDLWSDGLKLKIKWPLWVREYSGDAMRNFLRKFEMIYVMAGNEYKPTASLIKEVAPNIKKYLEAPSFKSQSGKIWGKMLNQYLLSIL